MIDVMAIVHNEALNLPYCLNAMHGWTNKIFVIDSGSTDGTQDIARSFNAQVVDHEWEGYGRQKNWGLANLPFESDWILIVDADEVVTAPLRKHLDQISGKQPKQVRENGFFINRLSIFMGQPIRHCGYFPNWNMRFFKRGQGVYEDREVHEHIIIDDPVGYIKEPMLHHDRRGVEHYVAKHNRYSTLEARSIYRDMTTPRGLSAVVNVPAETRRRRWLKRHVMPSIPFAGMWRFLYMYVIRLGVLDGRVGFQFSAFISQYDSMVSLKLRELRRRVSQDGKLPQAESASGLAVPEGDDPLVPVVQLEIQPSPKHYPLTQTQPEPSPWSFWEKVSRAVWMIVGKPIFRLSFHNWHRYRSGLLRLFGAKIGVGVAIRATVNVEIPWNLEINDDATVGDYAILYSLGKIKIGKRTIISQYSHLCAGTHDYSDHRFTLLRTPVTIGDDVWIGADTFIGPGVTVGLLAVLGARSSAYKNIPPHQVCVGNPARPIKERVLK